MKLHNGRLKGSDVPLVPAGKKFVMEIARLTEAFAEAKFANGRGTIRKRFYLSSNDHTTRATSTYPCFPFTRCECVVFLLWRLVAWTEGHLGYLLLGRVLQKERDQAPKSSITVFAASIPTGPMIPILVWRDPCLFPCMAGNGRPCCVCSRRTNAASALFGQSGYW